MGYGSFGSHVRARGGARRPTSRRSIGFERGGGDPGRVRHRLPRVRPACARPARARRVLIHAATGAVGLAAIEVARDLGAEIYATAGSHEKREYLRSLGIEHVFDSRIARLR